ncbi:MAG TPA: TRAP transporter substrate-binding protein [Syntrophorhabdaceae bacterium]|nr:TRAP transporter substrate-binding protein [Syntrophorhabdaceae bacterium]
MKVGMLRFQVINVSLAFLFMSLLLFAGLNASAEAQVLQLSSNYKWKMTSTFPPGMSKNKSLLEFISKIDQRTNGKVKITIYEGTLGAPGDQWDMVKDNTIQISLLADGYNVGRMPVTSLFYIPFELANMEVIERVYDEWMKAGYLKELTDNFKVLWLMPTNLQHLFLAKKKVSTLADFKGLKLRAVSGVAGQIIGALGASGVSMSGGETYMALQTGAIDGTITGIDNVMERKLYDMCKYALYLPMIGGTFAVAMNKETWNSLPKDLQAVIDQLAKEISQADLKREMDMDKRMWDNVSKGGITVYTISAAEQAKWKKATEMVDDNYLKEWSAKGYPVKEALAVMRKISATARK